MFPINPPLLNSSNRWATTKEELEALYLCPHTGAITTRTSLQRGFDHDDTIHQHCFFETSTLELKPSIQSGHSEFLKLPHEDVSSLNTLGYSPISIFRYADFVHQIQKAHPHIRKPVIFSFTGTPRDVVVAQRFLSLAKLSNSVWGMEINLSCPNIPDKPPPAYDSAMLTTYLHALLEPFSDTSASEVSEQVIEIGLKLPPYTYAGQFTALMTALEATDPCPISFLTSTNTLGSSLLPMSMSSPCLQGSHTGLIPMLNSSSGEGIGGLAGAALHPLALGNVRTLRRMLDERPRLKHIRIIGVGGVSDMAAYARMKVVGADAVGVGTGLGYWGVGVFERILSG